jgi:hypothetical protein
MATRQCGDCSLCCKILDVLPLPDDPFQKSAGKWCQHCKAGKACGIYQQRYKQCRDYECEWLCDDSLPDYWWPRKSKMILNSVGRDDDDEVLLMNLICDVPGVWRKEPYITDIKSWIDDLAPCIFFVMEPNGGAKALFHNDIEIDIRDLEFDRHDINSEIDMRELFRRCRAIITDKYGKQYGIDYEKEYQRYRACLGLSR